MTNLTATDMDAIMRGDADYILNKGAEYYRKGDYENAVEYYHLASAMGEGDIPAMASSNLGYCYLYGRHTEQNVSLAIAYFQIAGSKSNIDALYKLGNIYSNNKFVEQDTERSVYYYELAINAINNDYEVDAIDFPSLYFSVGKEYMPEGILVTNIEKAYSYLNIAYNGYRIAIANGNDFYKDAFEEVERLLELDIFADCIDEF